MPYKTEKELPDAVKSLPPRARRIFMSAYNSSLKTYSGNEETAAKVSWAAVKTKFKKSGDKWIAKQSPNPKGEAIQSLSDTKRIYEAYWNDGGDTTHQVAIETLLAEAKNSTTREDSIAHLSSINELLTPSFEFLEQHIHDFPGSLDHHIRMVTRAAREECNEWLGHYGWILAVYPNFIVGCGYHDGEDEYWKIDYQINKTGEIEFGDAKPVDVLTVVVPQMVETSEEYMEGKEQSASIEANKQVTQEKDISVSPFDILIKAFPNLSISLLQDTQNIDPQWFAEPEWLSQGPPGGDEELVQNISFEITQKEMDTKSCVMKIQGVATVGDVVNAMGEVYPMQIWQDNLPFLQNMAKEGSSLGESDHPSPGKDSLDKTSVIYDNFYMDGNNMMFEGRVLPTMPSGLNLQVMLQNGAKIDVSSRGKGTRVKGDWVNPQTGERFKDVMVVQRGFRCQTFDIVKRGASPGATITSYQMAQSVDADDAMMQQVNLTADEEIDVTALEKLTQQVEQLAASINKIKPQNATEEGKNTQNQSATDETQNQALTSHGNLAELVEQRKLLAHVTPFLIQQRIVQLVEEAREEHKLPDIWLQGYRKALEGSNSGSIEDLESTARATLAATLNVFNAAPKATHGAGYRVQQDPGSRPGPKTCREMLDFLVRDLDDNCKYDPMSFMKQDPESGELWHAPDAVRTQKRQVKQILTNIAKYDGDDFHGPDALRAYTRLFQGYNPREVQDAWMDQACADGTVSVAAGGAPSSAIFIFPLIRAVYPQLIAPEIASIQPMDRPDGKIFFLNTYRITTGINSVDQAGVTQTNRTFADNSSSFSSSYSDRAAECDTSVKIQIKLAGVTVTAQSKSIFTENTIEELQDLRAYHGLDVHTELVSAMSREIALEWNLTVLNEMAAGATAGTFIYGTTTPANFTVLEWEQYITRFVDQASAAIFKNRHGAATHLIAGPDAIVKLGAAYRAPVQPGGPNPEQFPGLLLNPWMAGTSASMKVFQTSFWTGQNANTILVLRRGADWSDTGYVFAPYLDYISPNLTLPDTLTQQQGVLSRAAHQVVVGKSLAKITINSSTGQPII